ncbi:hypothetical protein AB0H73_25810 [Streptomyces olivoreticuli]
MANAISRALERVKVWFAPPAITRPARAAKIPAPLPTPPLADPPTDSGSSPHFIWITAHGIDFRTRQPRRADVSR